MTRGVRAQRLKRAALGLAAVLLLAPAAAPGQTVLGAAQVEKYNRSPLTVPVPPSLAPADVEAVLVSTLEGRKWTVVARSPEQVVATLVHRDFDAKVVLKVEGAAVKILSESTYKSPETGKSEPAIPKGWLKNLEKDLKVFLARRAGQK